MLGMFGLPWLAIHELKTVMQVLVDDPTVSRFRLVCGACPPPDPPGMEVSVLYRSRSHINVRVIRKVLLQRFLSNPKCGNRYEDIDEKIEPATEMCVFVEITRE